MKQLLLAALLASSAAFAVEKELTPTESMQTEMAELGINYVWVHTELPYVIVFKETDPVDVCALATTYNGVNIDYVYNSSTDAMVKCGVAKYTDETTEKPI